MKKILLLFGAALLLSACASSDAYVMQNCTIANCDITAIHHHAIY